MVRTSAPRRRSFALVDCIVATVLLGASLAVMIGLSGQALTSQRVGEHLSIAAMLADEQLHLLLARGPDSYAQRFPVEGTCDAPFTDYKFSLTLGSGDPVPVTCTISWAAGKSEDKVIVETLISSRSGGLDADPNPPRAPQATIDRNAQPTTPTPTTTPTP